MAYTPAAYTPGTHRSLDPEQIAHLQEASLAVTASLDSGEVLRRVVGAARALLKADAVVLFGRAASRSDLPILASEGLEGGGEGASAGEAAVGKAIKEQQVVGVEDLSAAPHDRRRPGGFAHREGFCSVLAAPLAAAARERLGALALYTRERRAWTHEEATLLSLFATQAAVALQNARLYERLDRRAAELQVLFELSHLLAAFAEREPMLTAVISRLSSWMGAKYGAVMLVEPNESGEDELKVRGQAGFGEDYVARANRPGEIPVSGDYLKGRGPASVAVREKRPCAIGDVFLDERFAPFRPYAIQAGYLSLVAVPIRGQGRAFGAIVLYFAQRRDFGQAEMKMVEAAADGVALALDRISLSERLLQDAVARRAGEETDRLKGEFVSTVSHELRTPLTIIKGYTDLVASEQTGPLNETQKKFLTGVQRNTVRLTELVSDLLDISRLEASAGLTNAESVDLARVLADACTDFERVAGERRIMLACAASPAGAGEAEPPADVCLVRGDSERLRQIVNNLLSNAVKYSPSGGVVVVACAPQNGDVVVTVRDEGPGIPLEAQGRLFQRFYRVDGSSTRKVGGTGLGLAIAKAIVEQHGGKIWVESRPGEGSTFGFSVPRLAAAGGTAAEKK